MADFFPNLAISPAVVHSPTVDTLIKKPEYLFGGSPGTGRSLTGREVISITVKQGASPVKITWDAAYDGVSDTKFPATPIAFDRNTWWFRVESLTLITLIGHFSPST